MNDLMQRFLSCPGRTIPTLEHMHRIDAWQGHVHRQFRSIHVGGTNGKGSVCYKIAEALRFEGYRVGLYSSPHMSSFRERISINGELISEEAVESLLPAIMDTGDATFFEYATALAFAYFAQEKVDYAVIEVGLGGRFDATNVIEPLVSVITSIHYDHMNILGNTLGKIAKEKGGIIKPGIPAVLGPRVPLDVEAFRAPTSTTGFYDDENSSVAKIALQILKVSEASIEKGIKTRPLCRFEQVADRAVLDVAHNPDGIDKLVQAAQLHFPRRKLHYIVAFSQDKDARSCLQILKNSGRITCVGGSFPQLLKPEVLASLCDQAQCAPTVGDALIRLAPDEIAIVCGSFFIMNEARKSIAEWAAQLPTCDGKCASSSHPNSQSTAREPLLP